MENVTDSGEAVEGGGQNAAITTYKEHKNATYRRFQRNISKGATK